MAWADVVENEEQAHGAPLPNLSKQLGNDFPSLAEAAKAPPPGKKAAKPKATKMSFSEFVSMPGGGSATFQDKNLQQKAILASLPTSSRGLPREEGGDSRFPGGMGGPGFRDYGARGGAEGGGEQQTREVGGGVSVGGVSWQPPQTQTVGWCSSTSGVGGACALRLPSCAGFSREDRPPREDMGPSRADTIDDWGSTRTFTPSGGAGGGGGSRYGGGAGGGGGGGFGDRADRPPREPYRATAADDTEDWGRDRKFEPSAGGPPRGGAGRPPFGAGGGFPDRDSGAGPRGGGGEEGWGRGRDYKPADDGRPARGFSGSREDSAADKEDRWSRRAAPSSVASPSGADGASAAAGGERPRLKLAPRTAPIEQPSTSAPAAADAGQPAAQPQPKKPSSNPFGAARPREEVLKEKGVDPIKEALKLEHGEVARCAQLCKAVTLGVPPDQPFSSAPGFAAVLAQRSAGHVAHAWRGGSMSVWTCANSGS